MWLWLIWSIKMKWLNKNVITHIFTLFNSQSCRYCMVHVCIFWDYLLVITVLILNNSVTSSSVHSSKDVRPMAFLKILFFPDILDVYINMRCWNWMRRPIRVDWCVCCGLIFFQFRFTELSMHWLQSSALFTISPNHLDLLAKLPPNLKLLLLQHSKDG